MGRLAVPLSPEMLRDARPDLARQLRPTRADQEARYYATAQANGVTRRVAAKALAAAAGEPDPIAAATRALVVRARGVKR